MASNTLERLVDLAGHKPWLASDPFKHYPGMLGPQEAMMFYHVAKDVFRGVGTVVDAGSFLGKSAFYLSNGLRENPSYDPTRDRIHCFDNFIVNDPYTVGYLYLSIKERLAVGDSTRAIFDSWSAPFADMLEVHQGDFLTMPWASQPIEILFIDIAKRPALGGHVVELFFPDLIVGESVVIHQDYHHPWLPHIHVTMEYLAEYFELVIPRVNDSAVFHYRKAIPAEVLMRAIRYDFTDSERVELMGRAIARLPAAERCCAALAGLFLRMELGYQPDIRDDFDELQREFPIHEVDQKTRCHFEDVGGHLRLVEGWYWNRRGEYAKSLEIADGLPEGARNGSTMTMRGVALRGLRRYDEAEEQLREALKQKPVPARAYMELAGTLIAQNRLREAEDELLRGLPSFVDDEIPSVEYLKYFGMIWDRENPLPDKTAIMAALEQALPGDPEVQLLNSRRAGVQ
jgi:tetratricopeptide (TPR) repeat protein